MYALHSSGVDITAILKDRSRACGTQPTYSTTPRNTAGGALCIPGGIILIGTLDERCRYHARRYSSAAGRGITRRVRQRQTHLHSHHADPRDECSCNS